MSAYSFASFTITYEAAPHLLVGRWLADASDEELCRAYKQLLATAKAHDNCRFWLLDRRRRTWRATAITQWFADFLTGQAVRELGSPIFLAYIADEEDRAGIESAATAALLQQAAKVEFYPFFFRDEAAARDWLAYYQTHPTHTPPLPPAIP